nr:DNA polymerase lambda isoform X2 [Arachis hypogaea]
MGLGFWRLAHLNTTWKKNLKKEIHVSSSRTTSMRLHQMLIYELHPNNIPKLPTHSHSQVHGVLKKLEDERQITQKQTPPNKPTPHAKMAPKTKPKKKRSPSSESEPDGMFSGMVVFFVPKGVQPRRLQIWKQRLVQMGGVIEERLSRRVTHVFAMDSHTLLKELDKERLSRFKGKVILYQWLEDSLKSGEKLSEDMYELKLDPQSADIPHKPLNPKPTYGNLSSDSQQSPSKKIKLSSEETKVADLKSNENKTENAPLLSTSTTSSPAEVDSFNYANTRRQSLESESEASSLPYCPPDLNKNITEIFGKLVNIYRALGDDRRSFSYYKAIAVIEKLPFKIESTDQIKDLPSIGKSMKDHVQEIITTGKLSKLEHFETDEKVQEMERILQKVGEEVLPGVIIVCGGSYRRGKATCGDIDVIITHPDGQSHKGFLPKFVQCLKDIDFLREDLVFSTHSEEGTDSGVDTYFGFCTYPGRELRHRIDLKVYPRDIYAFGLIAWTGNDVLNRRLRLLAESKGFRLDDTGLFPATQGSGGKRGAKGIASLKFDTEKEVFDFLGFPWLEPHERNL